MKSDPDFSTVIGCEVLALPLLATIAYEPNGHDHAGRFDVPHFVQY